MKKDFVMPIAVLSMVCIVVTGALAIGHSFTQPIIAAASEERARMAMIEIIPDAAGFETLELHGLPGTINSVHRSTNNVGYIFIVTTPGFGGGITIICGVDPAGRVIRTAVLSHTETPTFAAPVFAESHISQFWGQTRYGIEDIAVVSGSTVTSVALRNALRDAFYAFELVSGGAR